MQGWGFPGRMLLPTPAPTLMPEPLQEGEPLLGTPLAHSRSAGSTDSGCCICPEGDPDAGACSPQPAGCPSMGRPSFRVVGDYAVRGGMPPSPNKMRDGSSQSLWFFS